MAGRDSQTTGAQGPWHFITWAGVALGVTALFAICLHSLEEIHYLKSFFPRSFTVEEAFYAAGLELVKILILALPILTAIAIALFSIRRRDRSP